MAVSQILLIVYMICMAAGLPVDQRGSDDANEADTSSRFRSGAGNPRTPQRYILDLYESVYENGIPTDEATDVWVFIDKDIAGESFREKPFINTKCVTYTQYVFPWSSVIQSLNIRNSTLHAYIQTINRHFTIDEHEVNVTLTVTMIPYNENGTSNTSDLGDGVIARQKVVSVSRGSDGWMELNVTKGMEDILPQIQINNYTDIRVIIKAEVDCNNQKKVPFYLINPAEIPLDQVIRRERQMDNQPFLVVFCDNEETKEALRKQNEEVTEEEYDCIVMGELVYDCSSKRSISKRSIYIERTTTYTSSCQKSNYTLDFHEIGLTNVIVPRHIDISKCSGVCNDRRVIYTLGTGHAKLMAAIYNRQLYFGKPVTATVPCCVPTKYETVFLLLRVTYTVTAIQSHSNLKAMECGCR